MAKEIKTQVNIAASAAKIWNILTDFNAYPKWNPFIKSVSGSIKVGSKITVRLEPPNGSPMTVKPLVLTFSGNKEFKWVGQLLMPGIFTGEHKFEIIENANGTCTFIQSEKFNGILIPFFSKMLDDSTTKAFELMNQALKLQAEK